jgi:hypothetical protein
VKVVEGEPRHLETERAEVVLQIPPQNTEDDSIVGLLVVYRPRLEQEEQPLSCVPVRVVRPPDLVNDVVAEGEFPEGPRPPRLGESSSSEQLPDSIRSIRMFVVRYAIDQEGPIEVATTGPLGSGQGTEHDEGNVLGDKAALVSGRLHEQIIQPADLCSRVTPCLVDGLPLSLPLHREIFKGHLARAFPRVSRYYPEGSLRGRSVAEPTGLPRNESPAMIDGRPLGY